MNIAKTKRANDNNVPNTLKPPISPPLYTPYRLKAPVVVTSTYRIRNKQCSKFFGFQTYLCYFSRRPLF